MNMKHFLIPCTGLLFSSSLLAATFFPVVKNDSQIINTITFETPLNKPVKIDYAALYKSNALKNPCASLVKFRAGGGDNMQIPAGTYFWTEEKLTKNLGPGATCFRVDYIRNGQTYSTGNIRLLSTGEQYRQSIPADETIRF